MASRQPERPSGPAGGSGYGQTLVAVFRTRAQADRAARTAMDAGVPADRIGMDRPEDEMAAIHAEMREEVEHTAVAAPVGPFTKEMTKGLAKAVPIGVLIGMAIALPFAFIPVGGVSFVARLIIALGVGAAAGGVAGLVIGGGLGAKRPAEPVAAERGVTVRIRCRSREEAKALAERLERFDPIRVDLMTAFGQPSGTVATEEELR